MTAFPLAREARWVEAPDHVQWLREQARRQLRFGRNFPHPEGAPGTSTTPAGPGPQRDETRSAYAPAFVVFAASSATVAGSRSLPPGGDRRLSR